MATCETKSYMKKPTFTRACLSDVRVIMVIIRVPLVELLCQAVMEWIPVLEYLLSGVRGACGHVLSYQVVKVTASRDSMLGKNYPILEAPGWSDWMFGPVPSWRGRWIG
jgi:hypothetical protein